MEDEQAWGSCVPGRRRPPGRAGETQGVRCRQEVKAVLAPLHPPSVSLRCCLTLTYGHRRPVAKQRLTLRPRGLQPARLTGPLPPPGARSHSCPLSQHHPTISSSVWGLSSQDAGHSGCCPGPIWSHAYSEVVQPFLFHEGLSWNQQPQVPECEAPGLSPCHAR